MSLPGFKPSVALELKPGRLIDHATGVSLELSEDEALILSHPPHADGVTSLADRVAHLGLIFDPAQVDRLFHRFSQHGFLVEDTFSAPPPEDALPKLRSDLVIAAPSGSGGTIEVHDPTRDRTFTLYDFEVAIARMLDGTRSEEQILKAAQKLGIPASAATLSAFLRQLKAYRFLETPMSPLSSEPHREEWTIGIRELYQSALRLLRLGRYDEALEYVTAMAQAAPTNEATEVLRQRIELEKSSSLGVKMDFERLHTQTGPAPGLEPLTPFPEGDDERPQKRYLPWVMAGVVLLVILFRPTDRTRSIPCKLELDELAVPRALVAGTIATVDLKPGVMVNEGDALAHLAVDETKSAPLLESRLAELEAKMVGWSSTLRSGPVLRAQADVKKAQSALDAIEAMPKKVQHKKRKQLKQALDKAQATLAAKTSGYTELTEKRSKLEAQKVRAQVERERAVITAPKAGLFFSSEPLKTELKENDGYGSIVAPDFKLSMPEPFPSTATAAWFRFTEGKAKLRIEEGIPRLTVTSALVGISGRIEVTAGRGPWLFSLF
jgi:hypothetical protein